MRWYKGPPSLAITEHWNYEDRKDFSGGYCWMAQGPLPVEWVTIQTSARGLWGQALRDEMEKYNRAVGLKMVGSRIRVAGDDTDGLGDNDKALINHALGQMQASLEAVGATDISGRRTTPIISPAPRAWATIRGPAVVNSDCRSWDVTNL